MNLFDLELEQGAITGNGADSANNTRVRTVGYIELEKGTYAFSYSGVKNAGVYRYNMNNNFIDTMLPWTAGNFHFTITEKCKLRFAFMTDNNTTILPKDITKIKLQKGSVVTPWSPYGCGTIETISKNGSNTSSNIVCINKPLCCVGDVRDELDYTNKKIIRNCGRIVLDGTENFYQTGLDNGILICALDIIGVKSGLNLNTHFPINLAGYYEKLDTRTNGKIYIGISVNSLVSSNADGLKSWLAEQYTNGTPVEVVYILATPIIEDIDCTDKIAQFDEQTTVYNTDGAEIEVSLTNNTAIAEVNENLDKIEKITNNYSLEEQIIGKWINRKPLYRKVVVKEFEVSSQSSGLINLPHGIVNVKEVTGVCAFSENGQRLPYIDSIGGITILDVVSQSHIQIRYQNSSWNKVKWYFVLEYTKTTD